MRRDKELPKHSLGHDGKASVKVDVQQDGSPKKRSSGIVPKQKPPFLFAGIFGILLSSLVFSFSGICIKLLPPSDGIQDKVRVLFSRSWIVIFCTCGSIIGQRLTFKVRREEIWVNAMRATFGCIGTLCFYTSLSFISIGDSTALVFLSPVWTSLLGYFVLKEQLQWILSIALPACIVGIIFIAHPALLLDIGTSVPVESINESTANLTLPLDDLSNSAPSSIIKYVDRWPGIVGALGSSLCLAFIYIVLKYRRHTPIQTVTFYYGLTSMIFSLLVLCIIGFGPMPKGNEWLLFALNGFFSWAGESLMQWALKYEDVSVLSIVKTLEIAMSFSLSALFLDDEIFWTSILGGAIIGGVVVLIVLNNWFKASCLKTEDHANHIEEDQLEKECKKEFDHVSDRKLSLNTANVKA